MTDDKDRPPQAAGTIRTGIALTFTTITGFLALAMGAPPAATLVVTGLVALLIASIIARRRDSHATGDTTQAPPRIDNLLGRTVCARRTRVHDGDEIVVAIEGYPPIRVRLADVAAPKHDQPGAKEAQRALERLTRADPLTLTVRTRDRYGRLIADVYNGKEYISRALVREGHAWNYARHTPWHNQNAYQRLERQARKARRGLWKTSRQPVAPWDWRATSNQSHHDDGASPTGRSIRHEAQAGG